MTAEHFARFSDSLLVLLLACLSMHHCDRCGCCCCCFFGGADLDFLVCGVSCFLLHVFLDYKKYKH